MATKEAKAVRELLALREAAGLSQTKLAGLIESSSSMITNWERGYVRPGDGSKERLAAALGVSFEEVCSAALESYRNRKQRMPRVPKAE